MFDTMTTTKILGAACGSLLVFLLLLIAAEAIYQGGEGHSGANGEIVQGYKIEVAEASGSDDSSAEAEVDIAQMMATADAEKGAKVFNKCKSCHKLEDGANTTGPHLFDIIERQIAVVDGFKYSSALLDNTMTWTVENLNDFLESPKGWAPGTKMTFPGLKKATDRANIIAYLSEIGS